MTYRFWDYKNPPKMTEGENPYWTPEERKQYTALHKEKAWKYPAPSRFEQEMFSWMNNEYGLDWYVNIAAIVTEWDVPRAAPRHGDVTWQDERTEMINRFVANLHDEDMYDTDYCDSEEVQFILWLFKQTPYVVYTIYLQVKEKAEEALRDNLLEIAYTGRTDGYLENATQETMKKLSMELEEWFEKSEKEQAERALENAS